MENTKKNYQVSEITITYNPTIKPSLRPRITGSKDAHAVLIESWDKDKIDLVEQFKVMLLNRANRVLGIVEISTGGIAGTVADPKLIFASALKAAASGMILSHNHPSGNLQASQADIELTKRLRDAGKLLEIQVLDHVIVTSEGYFSFADEGLV